METRERARIIRAKAEVERGCFYCINLTMEGVDGRWGQMFGGIVLGQNSKPTPLSESYIEDLCAAFEVGTLDELVGKECYVLRCFPELNESIEGLETLSGKRFTITAWRRKHWPDTKSPLAEKRERLEQSIKYHQRNIRALEAKLVHFDANYVDWEEE